MPKVTPLDTPNIIKAKTTSSRPASPNRWWDAASKVDMFASVTSAFSLVSESNRRMVNEVGVLARLYGNMPLAGPTGSNPRVLKTNSSLPNNRPTMSVITSCIDTLTARMGQNKPRPLFLTDNGSWRERKKAKQRNAFIQGEFYQTKAHEKGLESLRDACVFGTGLIKILEDADGRVALERRLPIDLLVDEQDAFYGEPRQLFEKKLMERDQVAACYPKAAAIIEGAQNAILDETKDATSTIADMVLVAEAWHLPSSQSAKDGLHVIFCDNGVLFEEPWHRSSFPFAKLRYSNRIAGFWGQGLAERQMGTQMSINQLLYTITKSINLVGVPRVFVEEGSAVLNTALNNEIGTIVKYRGTKPSYEVAPCVPVELYRQLDNLIGYAYKQEGISELASSSQKPSGLNSGAALREFEDIQSDRFATLSKAYDEFFKDLAYQVIYCAADIAKREGSYQTLCVENKGVKKIDLEDLADFDDPFIIQCYESSNLPKTPAGRLSTVTEMMQAGLLAPEEGRRLLSFPDIEQVDRLENASEERILKQLDDIVYEGIEDAPDNYTNLEKALDLSTKYINLYAQLDLEEDRMQGLRTYFQQAKALLDEAQAPPPVPEGTPPSENAVGGPPPTEQGPMAQPLAPPTSDLLPV